MIYDSNGSVSNLIGDQKLMKLSEITVCLGYVEQVQSKFDALFVIISECSTNSTKQCLMFEHNFHVFIAKTKI